jgi:hypothetical protein
MKLYLAIPLVSSLSIALHDASAVLSDISAISNSIIALTGAFNSCNGSYRNPIIIAAFWNLKSEIETTISNTKASPLFINSKSTSVAEAFQDLTPPVINIFIRIKSRV